MANRGGQIKPYNGEPPHWKHELCDYGSSFSRFRVISRHTHVGKKTRSEIFMCVCLVISLDLFWPANVRKFQIQLGSVKSLFSTQSYQGGFIMLARKLDTWWNPFMDFYIEDVKHCSDYNFQMLHGLLLPKHKNGSNWKCIKLWNSWDMLFRLISALCHSTSSLSLSRKN